MGVQLPIRPTSVQLPVRPTSAVRARTGRPPTLILRALTPSSFHGHVWRNQEPARSGRYQRSSLTRRRRARSRSEEHTSELQSLMHISYAVFCLKTKKQLNSITHNTNHYSHL